MVYLPFTATIEGELELELDTIKGCLSFKINNNDKKHFIAKDVVDLSSKII